MDIPFIIHADRELVLEKINTCDSFNIAPTKLYTLKINKHTILFIIHPRLIGQQQNQTLSLQR